jgi:hypothetical protein
MDNIDIIDPTFSLDTPNLCEFNFDNILSRTDDYGMYLYVGIASFVIIIGAFIFYNYFKNKTSKQNEDDCPGGFCTMGQPNQ